VQEKEIGRIAHYYNKIGVAVIEITDDALNVGDTIHIKGHTTDLTQDVESIQVEHEQIQTIKVGDAAGIRVKDHVREHDIVYKVEE
jgi:translation elongation factor EF-1alpha